MAFWLKAIEEPISLSFPDKKTPTALRHRLYKMRKIMEKENPELYRTACRVTLVIRPLDPPRSGNHYELIAAHSDHQFDKILEAAGLSIPQAPELE